MLLIPLRIVLITFLLTLLAFAVSLLLAIVTLLISAKLRGLTPNLAIAYRQVALPVAVVVGAIVLISAAVLEIRHNRRDRALAEIERAG